MNRSIGVLLMLAGVAFGLAGCATAPKDDKHRQALVDDSAAALSKFQAEDPGIQSMLNNAYGYAIFPSIGEGGLGVGGAYGRGTVYEQGRMIGYADVTKATVGLQAGGQSFAELIVFQDKAALDKFRNNQFAFQAGASAVAVKSGAAAEARYTDGVAVFTHTNGGLMAAAAIGGQKFTFVPVATQSSMSGQPPAMQASAPQQPAPPPHYEATGGAAAGGTATGGATVSGSSSAAPSASVSVSPAPVSSSPPPAAAPTTRPSGEQQQTPPKTVEIGTITEPSPAAAPAPGAPATRPTTAPSSGG